MRSGNEVSEGITANRVRSCGNLRRKPTHISESRIHFRLISARVKKKVFNISKKLALFSRKPVLISSKVALCINMDALFKKLNAQCFSKTTLCILKRLLCKKQDVLSISTTALGTGTIAMCKNKTRMYKMTKSVTPCIIRQLLHFLTIGSMSFPTLFSITASVSPIFTSKLR